MNIFYRWDELFVRLEQELSSSLHTRTSSLMASSGLALLYYNNQRASRYNVLLYYLEVKYIVTSIIELVIWVFVINFYKEYEPTHHKTTILSICILEECQWKEVPKYSIGSLSTLKIARNLVFSVHFEIKLLQNLTTQRNFE